MPLALAAQHSQGAKSADGPDLPNACSLIGQLASQHDSAAARQLPSLEAAEKWRARVLRRVMNFTSKATAWPVYKVPGLYLPGSVSFDSVVRKRF